MTSIPLQIASKAFDHSPADDSVYREYLNLQSTINRNFGSRVWHMTDACLSVILSITVKDLNNPIGLNLVDGPASEKTTVLSFFYGLPMVYRSDDFTPASFVTQAANVKKEHANKIDLLPRIQYKCLIVPELAPLFGADREELLQNFTVLTRVFDGEGFYRDGAVLGRRGYEGDYLFTWLGATVPIRPQVWKVMGSLGSRFLFLSLPSAKTQEDDIRDAVIGVLSENTYIRKREECRTAVRRFFEIVQTSLDPNSFARTICWKVSQDDATTVQHIGELATATARIRSEVNVWMSDSAGESPSCDFNSPIIEGPHRLVSLLVGLARGHAIANGRRNVTEEELPMIAAVAFSSMPEDRRRVLELVIEREHPDKISRPGEITSTEVMDILSFCKPTAIKILRTFDVLGVGRTVPGSGSQPMSFTLNSAYSWLCSDEFQRILASWRNPGDTGGTVTE